MIDTTKPPANDADYDPVMTADQIQRITGYRRPSEQLAELKKRGFYRARRSPTTGAVILERPHYEAICSTGGKAANDPGASDRPRVRTSATGKQ